MGFKCINAFLCNGTIKCYTIHTGWWCIGRKADMSAPENKLFFLSSVLSKFTDIVIQNVNSAFNSSGMSGLWKYLYLYKEGLTKLLLCLLKSDWAYIYDSLEISWTHALIFTYISGFNFRAQSWPCTLRKRNGWSNNQYHIHKIRTKSGIETGTNYWIINGLRS